MDADSALAGTDRLVGRDEELAFLLRAPRSGSRVVVIFGVAGVGKSRLADAYAARLGGSGPVRLVATGATAEVPFAAVLPLIPGDAEWGVERAALFGAVQRSLVEATAGAPRTTVVDDAHLLDVGSTALLAHLVDTGAVHLVATIRTGAPLPAHVRELWERGSGSVRLDLAPLAVREVGELVEHLLGGPVDPATVRWIAEATDGVPLFVCELVRGALDGGELDGRTGMWRWSGRAAASPRLTDLVEQRVEKLEPAEREALDVVAVSESVAWPLVEVLDVGQAVARLERSGLLRSSRDQLGLHVRVAHPLYGEAVRRLISPTARLVVLRRLVQAADGAPGLIPATQLAVWRLELGDPVDPADLRSAASEAIFAGDHATARQLAESAIASGGGVEAVVIAARAERRAGQTLAAAQRLERAEGAALESEAISRYLIERIDVLHQGLGRSSEALALLDGARGWRGDQTWTNLVDSLRSTVLCDVEELGDAVAVGHPLLDTDREVDATDRLRAGRGVGMSLVQMGRLADARSVADRLLPVGLELLGTDPELGRAAMSVHVFARLADARWDEIDALVGPIFEDAIRTRDSVVVGSTALLLGYLELMRGRPRPAIGFLRQGVAHIVTDDEVNRLPLAYGTLGQALALAGDVDEGAEAVRQAKETAASRPPNWHGRLEVARAEVQLAWARSEPDEVRVALGRWLPQLERIPLNRMHLLHLGAQLDGADEAHLAELAERGRQSDSRLLHAYADHAAALLAEDGAAVDAATATFADLGCALIAAHAAAQAERLHRAAGHTAAANRSREQHRAHLDRTVGVVLPSARRSPRERSPRQAPGSGLTKREREIAVLAAQGLSNAAIAERLVLSVRTVESHVYRACTKLGVRTRADLKDVLLGPEPAAP